MKLRGTGCGRCLAAFSDVVFLELSGFSTFYDLTPGTFLKSLPDRTLTIIELNLEEKDSGWQMYID